MDSDDTKWIADAIEKREANSDDYADKYNTLEVKEDANLYKHVINADLRIAPKKGQLYSDYLIELKVHVEIAKHKNYKTHVIIGVRGAPWYTHKRPDGCFMCEDISTISVLFSTMALMAQKHPKSRF